MRIIWSEIAQATFVRFMADQAGMMAVNRAVEALALANSRAGGASPYPGKRKAPGLSWEF